MICKLRHYFQVNLLRMIDCLLNFTFHPYFKKASSFDNMKVDLNSNQLKTSVLLHWLNLTSTELVEVFGIGGGVFGSKTWRRKSSTFPRPMISEHIVRLLLYCLAASISTLPSITSTSCWQSLDFQSHLLHVCKRNHLEVTFTLDSFSQSNEG